MPPGEGIGDVIAPPPGGLSSETNDNSVAILLTYGPARVLLAGDVAVRRGEYMAGGLYTEPLNVHQGLEVQNSLGCASAPFWPRATPGG